MSDRGLCSPAALPSQPKGWVPLAPGPRLTLTCLTSGPTADRNEWIRTLQQIAEERKSKAPERSSMSFATDSATELVDKSGFLELRGFKHKLFVVVAGDKVFLYKNAEVGCWRGCGTMRDPDAISRGTPSLCSPSLSRAAVSQSTHPSNAIPQMGTAQKPQGAAL